MLHPVQENTLVDQSGVTWDEWLLGVPEFLFKDGKRIRNPRYALVPSQLKAGRIGRIMDAARTAGRRQEYATNQAVATPERKPAAKQEMMPGTQADHSRAL